MRGCGWEERSGAENGVEGTSSGILRRESYGRGRLASNSGWRFQAENTPFNLPERSHCFWGPTPPSRRRWWGRHSTERAHRTHRPMPDHSPYQPTFFNPATTLSLSPADGAGDNTDSDNSDADIWQSLLSPNFSHRGTRWRESMGHKAWTNGLGV